MEVLSPPHGTPPERPGVRAPEWKAWRLELEERTGCDPCCSCGPNTEAKEARLPWLLPRPCRGASACCIELLGDIGCVGPWKCRIGCSVGCATVKDIADGDCGRSGAACGNGSCADCDMICCGSKVCDGEAW